MIYTLIARQKQVLAQYSPYQGNFSQLVKQKVLPNVNQDQKYSQFATSNYEFYFYIVDNFAFMMMVEKGVSNETRIHVPQHNQRTFLTKIWVGHQKSR